MTSKMHLLMEREDEGNDFLKYVQNRTMIGKTWEFVDDIISMFGNPSKCGAFLYWVIRYKKDGRLIGLSVCPKNTYTKVKHCFTIWTLDNGSSNIYHRIKKGISQGLKYLAVNTKQWQCVECGQVVIANYKPELNFTDGHDCDFSLLINKI